MTPLFYSKLSNDLFSILNDADDYNVIIKVGENENAKEFHAHSVILRARSPYFKGALSSCWIEKKNDMIFYSKPNIAPNVFDMILRYIYTGKLELTEQPSEDILELLIASDELLIEELFDYVQVYLIKERSGWIATHFHLVFSTAFKLNNCNKLQDYCFESTCGSFSTSNEFLSLDKDTIYKMLERDDIKINEVTAWEQLIKWGIKQTPGLSNDKGKWNNEDCEALKKTLSQLIPLIRFIDIPYGQFFKKVRPYKDIIPNNIHEDFENYYNYKSNLPKITTLPPRMRNFDSKVIKQKHANIIISWITKKDFYAFQDPRYEFYLDYRGSIDGISRNSFVNKCKGPLKRLVLIKVKQSGKIFGGYSSIGFNSIGDGFRDLQQFYNSSDNFIFSFENSEDTQNMKISRVKDHNKAICCDGTGFKFGLDSLFMYEDQYICARNRSHAYEDNLNTNEIFKIEEIEVYSIHCWK
ncbi:hypothetical protein GLOIN_2v1837748 [Rhizophagus irregularis DAOM 181602=DAOM 197198]|uniref:Serine-enriched protein n=5 Tax=Rhizophagus irregularis TaxID=588596 RepID=A0A015LTM6_RHIIW|nr:hypothetical protein GLOIN_2v1837748 [Rhizophagus irregularis DAOM 181602=DAOM 197198]EXX58038.1 hypothetical protein RirG_201680 [Rhizophagus irregularis DAOM 197198w]POG77005.1 hypothetical protein GLOIN_2v1837748 [Rhizophagus irregularis DAOM 181602=DAOM 197198]GBC38194.1 hypothetical protein GLOIN_2v1837748 [Rhizophagus irregularis DAOM 181602=DAOM 197198]|eukprot:XP_025183871.1 hypothetical protein GLOIN_2v1837748 [Rhizophagus irregularis DAOM 181602=DAOM 197198]